MSNEEYWDGEWPNLNSVAIFLPTYVRWTFPPASVGILYRLVLYVAHKGVWSAYSEPDPDPRIKNNPAELQRIAMCTKKEWKEFAPYFDSFFFLASDGYWRLSDETVIRLSRPRGRNALSAVAKAIVLSRDGQRCAYCGTLEGPFHFDHIFPVSRGGSDHATNLVLACAPCNMAKGSKTLAEWVGR